MVAGADKPVTAATPPAVTPAAAETVAAPEVTATPVTPPGPTLREKVGALSALAEETKRRFGETQAARQARLQAEQFQAGTRGALQSARQAATDAQAKLNALKADPLAFLESQGVTVDSLGEAILKRGTQDEAGKRVEAAIKAAQDAANAANKRAEDAEKKADAIVKAADDREARAQQLHAWEEAKAAVVTNFEKGAEQYQDLDAYVSKLADKTKASKPAVLITEFLATVERLKIDPKYGKAMRDGAYSDGEILAYMNEFYEGVVPRAEKVKPAAAKPAEAGPAPALSAKTAEEPVKPADAAKTPPPAISNQMASERAAPQLPEGFDMLTGKARTKAIAQMLRDGTLPGLTKTV